MTDFPPPVPTGKGHKRTVAIATAAAVGLVGVGVAVGMRANRTAKPAATTAVAVAPITTPITTAAPLRTWVEAYRSALVESSSTLGDDMKSISTAAANRDVGGVNAACARLQNDVTDARLSPQSLDSGAPALWHQALNDAGRAATLCLGLDYTGAAAAADAFTADLTALTAQIAP